jgi:hypothetical protein
MIRGRANALMLVVVAAVLGMTACGGGSGGVSGSGGNGGGGSSTGSASDWTTRFYAGTAGSPALSVAWNGTRAVAVEGNGGRWSSPDFLVWLNGTSSATLNDIAWDGSNFVAVGDSMSIEVSTDGLSWIKSMPSVTSAALASVTFSPTLQLWVAVGSAGAIIYAAKADPAHWTAILPAPTAKNLSAVTWTGDKFVAVGQAGTVLTSANGQNWTAQTTGLTSDLRSVAAASPTSIVALTTDLPSKIVQSSNATAWTTVSSTGVFFRLGFLNGRYLALGEYLSATSSDGTAWTASGTAPGFLGAAIYDGSRYVALGTDKHLASAVYASTDGLNWSPLALGRGLSAIARAPTGRVVAVGSDSSQATLDSTSWSYGNLPISGDLFHGIVWAPTLNAFADLVQNAANQYLYSSADGLSWTRVAYAPCYAGIAASPSTLVNVGYSYPNWCLATSTNGTSWTQRTVPTGQHLTNAFWTGSVFVALGQSGEIATAPADGSTWTAQSSGVATALNGAAGSSTLLVVVGNGGVVLTSADSGATWNARTSNTTEALYGVIWTGSEFVAVGSNATLLRSVDGVTWKTQVTPYSPGSFSYVLDFTDVSWSLATQRLTVVGSNGFTATLP